jgi:antagonist of KipI
MSAIEVVRPGAFSTIQDLGRFGWAHLGISPAGAADPLSLRIANRLVGNEDNAAAIEMTLTGATLRFRSACTIASAGAGIGTDSVPTFEPVEMRAGAELECEHLREGVRSYLAVAGGVQVPQLLGSAATLFAAGCGGFEGRPLRRGDILETGSVVGSGHGVDARHAVDPARLRALARRRTMIRVSKGPHHHWFGAGALTQFCAATYRVTAQSNRMGLRLEGEAVQRSRMGELLTEGVSLGAIQIPPNGQPIVLFVDQQTTGGYPVLANIISADLHCVGQLLPGNAVRFELVSIPEALQALREQERALAEAFGK